MIRRTFRLQLEEIVIIIIIIAVINNRFYIAYYNSRFAIGPNWKNDGWVQMSLQFTVMSKARTSKSSYD